MSDLNQRLAEIRNMQGLPPMPNPHVIQGFGAPGDLPSPPPPQNPPPDYILNPEDEPDDDQPIPSALFPKKPAPAVGGAYMPPQEQVAGPSLAVMDRVAGWRGRGVDLTEQEEAAVRRIVLGAIQRELNDDLAAVAAPRRARKPRTTPETPKSTEATGGALAKRGRPRKVTA